MSLAPPSVKKEWRTCPKCRQHTLAFTNRYAVLTRATELLRTGTDPHDGKDRLRYEAAWVCQNSRCDYRERVLEDRP
jgi:hypothetical protein